jgi:hypothetical protein
MRHGRSLGRWGTRAQIVVSTTKRQFAYRWTAPQSPALRMLVLPLFLGAALLALLVGVLAVALALVAAAVAILALAVVGILYWIRMRLRLSKWELPR